MNSKVQFLNGQICLVMALEMESQGRFEKAGYFPVYSGVGKVNAALTAQKMIDRGAKVLVNLGTAGSRKLNTHEIVHVTDYVQRDFDLTPLGLPFGETPFDPYPGKITIQSLDRVPQKKTRICGTGDSFETKESRVPCDLVDMEGYALAKVCLHASVPFYSVKYITDGAIKGAESDWKNNLSVASEALLAEFQSILPLLL